MIARLERFRYALLSSILIYTIGFLISISILLILNIDLGKPSFDKDLGSWLDIFIHNIQVQLFLILGGVTLGLLTIFLLFINGLFSGFVVAQSLLGAYYLKLIGHVALHGILENIAFFLSGAIGIQFSSFLLKNKFSKKTLLFFNKSFFYKLFTVILLTLIAAVLES